MKKNHIIIIILSIIIVTLIALVTAMYLKNEYLEDRYENYDNYIEDKTTTQEDNDSNNSESSKYISSNEALQVVLQNLGINKENIYDLDNEFDYKYGKQIYDIDFKYNGYEYEFYIDAKTSEIVKSFKERD